MSQKLAEYFIEVATKGLDEANSKLGQIVETTKKNEQATQKLQGSLKGMQDKMIAFGGVAANIYSSLYSHVTNFTRAAMQNTQEGYNMERAFAALNKVVGNIFAPYIRLLTQGIQQLVRWFNNLTQETKSLIAQVTIVAIGVTSLAVITPVLIAALAGIGSIIAVILSPIGLLVAAIVGVIAVFAEASDGTEDWAEIFGESVAWMGAVWDVFKAGFMAGYTVLKVSFENIMNLVYNVATNWDATWTWIKNNWIKLLQDMWHNAIQIVKNIASIFGELATAVWKWIKSGFKDWDFAFKDQIGKLAEGIRTSTDPIPDVLGKNLKDPLAEAAKAWTDGTGGIAAGFQKTRSEATALANKAKEIAKNMGDALKAKEGFQFRGNVGFEASQNTYQRLQVAFARNENTFEKASIQNQKDSLSQLQRVAAATERVDTKIGLAK